MLLVGDGRQRDRPAIAGDPFRERGERLDRVADGEFDLCRSCRNDLRRWWIDGGGDGADVARRCDEDGE
jgi:hypothetical protein